MKIDNIIITSLINRIQKLEQLNKDLKEENNKLKNQSSEIVKVDKRDLEIDIIIETMKSFNL
jgi:hypothetical protein